MPEFVTLRARRFHALHDLLTGRLWDDRSALPTYLAEDVGLPTAAPQKSVVSPLGLLIREGGQ